ncbi:ribonuclease G, putative [Babesia ovis]|uniref:Ribonuclease G, putative n=1 Tax=Babesia ovis TaxID=5869 RepID=A0A9W5TAW7_BABOV|nr:ribonuclease G, putative [Babesia ovis]
MPNIWIFLAVAVAIAVTYVTHLADNAGYRAYPKCISLNLEQDTCDAEINSVLDKQGYWYVAKHPYTHTIGDVIFGNQVVKGDCDYVIRTVYTEEVEYVEEAESEIDGVQKVVKEHIEGMEEYGVEEDVKEVVNEHMESLEDLKQVVNQHMEGVEDVKQVLKEHMESVGQDINKVVKEHMKLHMGLQGNAELKSRRIYKIKTIRHDGAVDLQEYIETTEQENLYSKLERIAIHIDLNAKELPPEVVPMYNVTTRSTNIEMEQKRRNINRIGTVTIAEHVVTDVPCVARSIEILERRDGRKVVTVITTYADEGVNSISFIEQSAGKSNFVPYTKDGDIEDIRIGSVEDDSELMAHRYRWYHW